MSENTKPIPQPEFENPQIKHIYGLKNEKEVLSYLNDHIFLFPLLLEAHKRIKDYFPSSELSLEVVPDPEIEDYEQLVLSILTTLHPDEAMERLDAFDEDWWLGNLSRAKNKLCIHL